MYTIATVVLENASPGFDREYSYFVPVQMEASVQAGCRVRVPFGGGNKARTGLVLAVAQVQERDARLKPISSVLDREPVLNPEGLRLLRYLRECTFCTWFDALKALIPTGIGIKPRLVYSSGNISTEGLPPHLLEVVELLRSKKNRMEESALCEKTGLVPGDRALTYLEENGYIVKSELLRQNIMDEKVVMVRLREEQPGVKLTKRQREAVAFLEENGAASLKEVCYYCSMTRAVVDRLRDHGVVEYYDEPRFRDPYENGVMEPEEAPALSEEQAAALKKLRSLLDQEKPGTALLYGVTGSGKTEVFLSLIAEVLARGKTVIVLVPEISLTAQTVRAFHKRFGERVAVLHSGLSLGERMDQWKRIREGLADIVVGTRSAVFAPLENVGLIVLDEEQEHTYHSEKSPRFHARDVAKFRCGHHGALLLLASATPSVESYHHAATGAYSLVTLEKRFGAAELPDVYVVDMGEAENIGQSHMFSERLLQELHYNLEHGEQSILLMNRRGYSTLVRCSVCGAVEECPNCSVSLTYHSANDSLVCHYCGYAKRKPAKCGECESEMIRYSGSGTQKIQEELESLYPDARILRIDMDTTLSKFSHEKLFHAFSGKEYDIMIGTQMVAKGLNFPNVTLVGVLAADQSLYAADFRSYERSFALLTQVVGRSGRGLHKGRALIQTYSPDHPIIALAAEQDYPRYFSQEIRSRKHHLYPPFCTMAGVGFVGVSLDEVCRWSVLFLEKFKEFAAAYPGLPIRVLGPVQADTLKVAGKYRRKLVIKCRNNRETRALFRQVLDWFYKECRTVTAFIDMHYDRI